MERLFDGLSLINFQLLTLKQYHISEKKKSNEPRPRRGWTSLHISFSKSKSRNYCLIDRR